MSSARKRPPAEELAAFFRSLAGLIRTEVPLGRALAIAARDDLRGGLARAAREMAQEVDEGVSLDDACRRRPDIFPELYSALVAAGIAAGDLPGALDEIAAHAARRGEIGRRVRRALTYPLVAAAVALALGVGVVAFALPRQTAFARAFDDGSIVARSALVPAGLGLGVLAALFVAAIVFGKLWSPLDVPSAWRLPLVGPIRCLADRTLLTGTLAMLLRREMPLNRAMALAADAGGSPILGARLARAAAAAGEGQALAAVLEREELLPPSLAWLVAAAEERSEVAEGLTDVAAICRDRLDRAVDRLVVLVRPLAELVVGVAVFLLALSFLIPALELADQVFGMN